MIFILIPISFSLSSSFTLLFTKITWSEFYNYILEPGDVERIVVVNKRIARVYLHPGSKGVPLHRPMVTSSASVGNRRRNPHSSQTTTTSSSSSSSLSSSRTDEAWEEDTILDMGNQTSEEGRTSSSLSSLSSSGTMRRFGDESNRPQQLVYHFQIGSVESFEEKLGKAQQELGISSRDFVPVR